MDATPKAAELERRAHWHYDRARALLRPRTSSDRYHVRCGDALLEAARAARAKAAD